MNDLLPGMSLPLMPHQIIGVQWMVDKEKSKHHGGILADSMGLGKTIQTIATMIANPSTDPTCKTTLIIAPLALLEQWKLEIEHKTYGQLSVYVFHGSNKSITKKQLKRYDVVLTSV
jgi:SNF2 family DNA or RNA helicase